MSLSAQHEGHPRRAVRRQRTRSIGCACRLQCLLGAHTRGMCRRVSSRRARAVTEAAIRRRQKALIERACNRREHALVDVVWPKHVCWRIRRGRGMGISLPVRRMSIPGRLPLVGAAHQCERLQEAACTRCTSDARSPATQVQTCPCRGFMYLHSVARQTQGHPQPQVRTCPCRSCATCGLLARGYLAAALQSCASASFTPFEVNGVANFASRALQNCRRQRYKPLLTWNIAFQGYPQIF